MKKFSLIISIIITLSMIPLASAADSSYSITFPDYFEKTGEDEWYAKEFKINDNTATVLATVNFYESELTEDFVFSPSSLDIAKQSTEGSENFVEFYEEPTEELVSDNNYRCIYRAYIIETNGKQQGIISYDFYSATQRCTVLFVASDPLFLHVNHFSDPKIIDSIKLDDSFFTKPVETTEETVTQATTTTEPSSGIKALILFTSAGLMLVALYFAFFKKSNTKTHAKKSYTPTQYTGTPYNPSNNDYLDDVTFIKEMRHISSPPWQQYDILFAARGYGWDMMLDWADYVSVADLENISQVTTGSVMGTENNLTVSFLSNGGKCKQTPELATESGTLSVAGLSKTLRAPVKIVWINQTNTLRLFTYVNDELLISKYVETLVRRSFGTKDQMKLGKPISKE